LLESGEGRRREEFRREGPQARRRAGQTLHRRRVDPAAGGEDEEPLDGIAQFADVAVPIHAAERLDGVGLEAAPRETLLLDGAIDEMLDEHRDVLTPLAQRRDDDRYDVEPEV